MAADDPAGMESTSGLAAATPAPSDRASVTWRGLRYTASNFGLAAMFFIGLIPARGRYNFGVANYIWLGGAALMGVLSLIRIPPRETMFNVRSVLATTAMMVAPAMMRPAAPSSGLLADGGIIIELIGVAFSQIARLYLGRRFGLLPANRGIVASGPFRLVRHPIYSGWFVLTIGFMMAYPSPFNVTMLLITLPFMMWRIALEEELLLHDPDYQAYAAKTRYRLLPGLF